MNIFIKLKLIWFILRINQKQYQDTYIAQRKKGYAKYGKYLEDCNQNDYNWKQMVLEEIVDAIQYIKLVK